MIGMARNTHLLEVGPFTHEKACFWKLARTVNSASQTHRLLQRLRNTFFKIFPGSKDRFSDNFQGDLGKNWDFEGPWRVKKGILLVTGSDAGGITKVGAEWKNYIFTFEAQIKNQCLGIVIRAADLNNYYMLQITKDKIQPYRRIGVPVLKDKLLLQSSENNESSQVAHDEESREVTRFRPANFVTAWQTFREDVTPVKPTLNNWFRVKVIVHGESIRLYINNELQFQRDSFLKIPRGKVGFRNHSGEKALVRDVQVRVQR
jgi:hypothetical protein